MENVNPVTAFVVFVIIWWLVLFTVLPWGVRRSENPEEGHDHGAPVRAQIGRKLLITTGIAIVLFGVFVGLVGTTDISLRDLAEKYAS
jgi:predicted secreted protein